MRQENGEMLPKQPQPQLPTPLPNASEGAEKNLLPTPRGRRSQR
jgi:hypothetical protein